MAQRGWGQGAKSAGAVVDPDLVQRVEEIIANVDVRGEVAIEMGGGPATVSARFALEEMDSIGLRAGAPV